MLVCEGSGRDGVWRESSVNSPPGGDSLDRIIILIPGTCVSSSFFSTGLQIDWLVGKRLFWAAIP